MHLSRRAFTIGCSAAIAALAGGRLGSLAYAAPTDTTLRDILVVVSLRGGADGLSLVAPTDDPHYVAARSASLRVADRGASAGLPLANALAGIDFRLHPLAAGLRELYDSQQLAIVHACGLAHGSRSHFEAIDLIERGAPRARQDGSGWITRYLAQIGADRTFGALATTSSLPVALDQSHNAVAMGEASDFALADGAGRTPALLRTLYRGDQPLHRAGIAALDAIDLVGRALPRAADGAPLPYEAEHGAEYPSEWHAAELSNALQTVARMIKMDVGLQVATVDYGGWDTHDAQTDALPQLVDGLARALAAFYNDMTRYHQRLTVVVVSEFGRRLRANESGGTDHGYGNALFVLGGNVNGGRMYGTWPGLATEQLEDGADLAITTEYRSVIAEIAQQRLGAPDLAAIFPQFTPTTALGLLRTS